MKKNIETNDIDRNIKLRDNVIETVFRDKKVSKLGSNYVNLISNCYDDSTMLKERYIPQLLKKIYIQRPNICHKYLNEMGYDDQGDQGIMECYFNHRNTSWKRCMLIFLFKLLMHNSKIINNFIFNEKKIPTEKYLLELQKQLAGRNFSKKNNYTSSVKIGL
ncbi:chimeric ercc6-pgbd3 protein-related [Anaeramoeba flamelloides]|uniref:Chimeric ercc6-pgbd3 protein-related n=1 Tax=Anaeramoeba flamelloides TaxID=1746091 RepID=A0AAV7Z025_9EUKA|nr:chimeric ercc6-pgbd3 protein-related [Anaeramoeba flamelloides]